VFINGSKLPQQNCRDTPRLVVVSCSYLVAEVHVCTSTPTHHFTTMGLGSLVGWYLAGGAGVFIVQWCLRHLYCFWAIKFLGWTLDVSSLGEWAVITGGQVTVRFCTRANTCILHHQLSHHCIIHQAPLYRTQTSLYRTSNTTVSYTKHYCIMHQTALCHTPESLNKHPCIRHQTSLYHTPNIPVS